MGRDKATLIVADKTLIRRTYDVVRHIFADIVVVSSLHDFIEGVTAPIVRDVVPFGGR